MKVKTPNNTNIASYLKPDTVYDVKPSEIVGLFEYTNHLLLNPDGTPSIGLTPLKGCGHLNGQDWIVLDLKNRNRLAHFIRTNNIRTTLVSRYLGYSKGWLTQAMTRTDRGDLDDSELQAIMDKLHIDWSSSEYVHVKSTKQHTAYKTKPCSHTTELHKARLQQSFWNGEFTHG